MKPVAETAFVALLALGVSSLDAQTRRKGPDRAEPPFRTFLTVAPEEATAEQEEELLRAREALGDRLRDNDDWFRLVDTPEEAELVVRLLGYSSRAERRVKSIWGVVPPTEDRQPDRTQVVEIQTTHTLRAGVQLLGAPATITGTRTTTNDPGGPEDAARALERRLEDHCRDRYWDVADRR